MPPATGAVVGTSGHSTCPFLRTEVTRVFEEGTLGLGRRVAGLVVSDADGGGVVDPNDSQARSKPVSAIPDGGRCEELGCEDANVERVRERGQKAGRGADDLIRLGIIVDGSVKLQDGIEKSVRRHDAVVQSDASSVDVGVGEWGRLDMFPTFFVGIRCCDPWKYVRRSVRLLGAVLPRHLFPDKYTP